MRTCGREGEYHQDREWESTTGFVRDGAKHPLFKHRHAGVLLDLRDSKEAPDKVQSPCCSVNLTVNPGAAALFDH